MGRNGAVAWVVLLVSVVLQGCPGIGDPAPALSHTWIIEAYAPDETVESVAADLPDLALEAGILELAENRHTSYWEKDIPPKQRRIRYVSRTMLDRAITEVIVVDLRPGVGIRFVFSGDLDDQDSIKLVTADLMRILTDRFGWQNVAFSPGLLQSKWQSAEEM